MNKQLILRIQRLRLLAEIGQQRARRQFAAAIRLCQGRKRKSKVG
jgi:hypothetical protein